MVNKFFLTASAAVLLCSAGEARADSLSDNHVVRSSNGNVVYSLGSGKCVRATNWEAGYDVCAPKQYTILSTAERTVYFPFDSAALTPQAQAQLNEVAQRLGSAPDVREAIIVGHADHLGASSYNSALSRKRAEAVKNYLAQRGYLPTRVAQVTGVGESQPTTACGDGARPEQIQCLSPDRKVDIDLHYVTGREITWLNQ